MNKLTGREGPGLPSRDPDFPTSPRLSSLLVTSPAAREFALRGQRTLLAQMGHQQSGSAVPAPAQERRNTLGGTSL